MLSSSGDRNTAPVLFLQDPHGNQRHFHPSLKMLILITPFHMDSIPALYRVPSKFKGSLERVPEDILFCSALTTVFLTALKVQKQMFHLGKDLKQ